MLTDIKNINVNGQDLKQVLDLFNPIGEFKTFPTFKDRSAEGLKPFAFANPVSKTSYALLYAEVGDMFEQSHLDAGDLASGVDDFYPTPIPGGYGRSGVPDIGFINTDVSGALLNYDTPTGFRNGTIFVYELLTGTTITNLVSGTLYYLRRVSANTLSVHPTEADAIADTGAIAIADGGAGTFRLTQEGISLKDAMKSHWHKNWGSTGALNNGKYTYGGNQTALHTVGTVGDPTDDGVNGPVNPTNETRPSTYYEFKYIRIQSILE